MVPQHFRDYQESQTECALPNQFSAGVSQKPRERNPDISVVSNHRGIRLTQRAFGIQGKAIRARLVLVKERILECLVSLMRYVQNLREFGFVVQITQQWIFVDVGIAEETGFNAHPQRT